jgi:hypothetical protein
MRKLVAKKASRNQGGVMLVPSSKISARIELVKNVSKSIALFAKPAGNKELNQLIDTLSHRVNKLEKDFELYLKERGIEPGEYYE